jgi:hypothetical protein
MGFTHPNTPSYRYIRNTYMYNKQVRGIRLKGIDISFVGSLHTVVFKAMK